MKGTTLKDISKHLGLSVTQVSRALNGYDDVSRDTKERVLEAAAALNYSPNLTARKLVSGKSGMVALVRRHYDEMPYDLNFLEIITGLSLEFSRRNMQFLLHVTPDDGNITNIYAKLIDGGSIDGFVVIEPRINDERILYLKRRGVPFVVHGRADSSPDYAYFDIDNFSVGYQLAKHLIDQGHRDILFLNGHEGRGYSHDRDMGYRRAFEEAGLNIRHDLLQHGRMSEEYGMRATIEAFGRERAPSAIICGHVIVAKGAYQALAALGKSIPGDVSVVAHDDAQNDALADTLIPQLTVTRAAIRNSWKPLTSFMQSIIDGGDIINCQKAERVDFVQRASTIAKPLFSDTTISL